MMHDVRRSFPPLAVLLASSLAMAQAPAPVPTPPDARAAAQAAREAANAKLVDEAKAHRAAWTKAPADEVRAHPGAAQFPGAVPAEAPRLQHAGVIVSPDINRWRPKAAWWHPTGLYAPAGEVITIDVPEPARAAGLSIRIGAHKDNSNPKASKFRRTPVNLTHAWPLNAEQVRVASAFGGPVYVEVPRPASPGGEPISLRISGAVAAPLFVLGVTTPEQWQAARAAPGPWAELASPHIAITVPSDRVRSIEDPTELMTLWERGAVLVHELGGGEFTSERLVWDPAISAGSMHSGHPIMCQGGLDSIVDLAKLKGGDVWGFFHEMGHNQQYGGWTPKGQGEVTCNWFPMYFRAEALGLPPFDRAEKWTRPETPMPRGEIGTGNPGGAGHFVALRIWRQIHAQFGWEPFRAFLRSVREPGYVAPATDEAKWDDMLVKFSRAAGHDLSPHFVAWGAEVSDEGLNRAAALGLPPWKHPGAPGP